MKLVLLSLICIIHFKYFYMSSVCVFKVTRVLILTLSLYELAVDFIFLQQGCLSVKY